MKKLEYVSPEVEIAKTEIQCFLFTTSGDSLDGGFNTDDTDPSLPDLPDLGL